MTSFALYSINVKLFNNIIEGINGPINSHFGDPIYSVVCRIFATAPFTVALRKK